MFEVILLVNRFLMRLFEFESREGGCNSLVMFFNFCFGDVNNIWGDCSVFGFVVESIKFDDLIDVWYGLDCGWDLFCCWVFNFLELIFDFGDNEKFGRGLMDFVDFGIG